MNSINNTTNSDFGTTWIEIPYLGDTRDQLLQTKKQKKLIF